MAHALALAPTLTIPRGSLPFPPPQPGSPVNLHRAPPKQGRKRRPAIHRRHPSLDALPALLRRRLPLALSPPPPPLLLGRSRLLHPRSMGLLPPRHPDPADHRHQRPPPPPLNPPRLLVAPPPLPRPRHPP